MGGPAGSQGVGPLQDLNPGWAARKPLAHSLTGVPSLGFNRNSYSLYCAELMANMKDVPSTERMVLCSQQWKLLSQKEKDAYHKKCDQVPPPSLGPVSGYRFRHAVCPSRAAGYCLPSLEGQRVTPSP